VTGQTTTAGLGNTGLLANTGNFTNSGSASIGGATQINNTLRVTGDTTIGVVGINATTGRITGASLDVTGAQSSTIASTGTTSISGADKTMLKGGLNSGIMTLQDGDAPAAGTTPAGTSITISGSAGGAAQTVFQTISTANTSAVTTRIGSASANSITEVQGRQITLGAADGSSTVTIPGIASPGGQRFVTTDSSGRVGYSANTINDYTSALEQVGNQVSSVGAVAAALSSIPNLTNGSSRYGCGVGTGVFGSAWAGAVGCVAKVSNSVWVNGALSYTPSITTAFGSTPSVAGRLGVFWQF